MENGVIKSIARWTFAVFVLAGVFILVGWLAGAIILRDVLKDPTVRWTVAMSAAIAMDAPVGIWVISFIKGDASDATDGVRTGAGKTRNSIKKTIVRAPVTQGRDINRPASKSGETVRTGRGSTRNTIANTSILGGTVIQGRDIGEVVPTGSEPEETRSQEK